MGIFLLDRINKKIGLDTLRKIGIIGMIGQTNEHWHYGILREFGCIVNTNQARKDESMAVKTVFTTGEAAKICKVSQQTIIRCFDTGQLKGFRVPGSRFRRIPREQLYNFMRENGIPTDVLEGDKRKILLVDDDIDIVNLIKDVLERDTRFEVRVANNGFDAGMKVKEYHPDLIVLDVMLPDINGKEVCQCVRSDQTMNDVKIICISGMVEENKIEELKACGATDFMRKPFDVDVLVKRICHHLEMEAMR